MKTRNLMILVLGSILLGACTPDPIDKNSYYVSDQKVSELTADGRVWGLNEFKATFLTERGNYWSENTNYRERAHATGHVAPNEYLDTVWAFSIDTLPSHGAGIYIRGRVCTDDYGGNFYKSLVIQNIIEDENGERAQENLRLSVDAGSVSGMYPLGQEILIRVNGLAIGKYANQIQLCVPTYNNNQEAMNAEQKVGWAPGRIPIEKFKMATTLIGKPDPSKLWYEELELSDFVDERNMIEARKWDGKLIRVSGVYFTGEYSNYGTPATCTTGDPQTDGNANVFAPTTNGIGYPQSRIIKDADEVMSLVSTSEYAKYSHFFLPESRFVGTITGILGFYHDNMMTRMYNGEDSNAPDWDDWSITPRSLLTPVQDIVLRDGDEMWVPKEYGTVVEN